MPPSSPRGLGLALVRTVRCSKCAQSCPHRECKQKHSRGGWVERCDAAATRSSPDEWPTRAQTLRPQLQPLSVPEHLDFCVHVDREAVLRAACALPNVFIFIFITYMYVPSSYCCRRVINVQRVTCVANDKHKLSCQNTWSKKVQWPL